MKRTLLSFLIILCTALAVQAQPAPVYTLKILSGTGTAEQLFLAYHP